MWLGFVCFFLNTCFKLEFWSVCDNDDGVAIIINAHATFMGRGTLTWLLLHMTIYKFIYTRNIYYCSCNSQVIMFSSSLPTKVVLKMIDHCHSSNSLKQNENELHVHIYIHIYIHRYKFKQQTLFFLLVSSKANYNSSAGSSWFWFSFSDFFPSNLSSLTTLLTIAKNWALSLFKTPSTHRV